VEERIKSTLAAYISTTPLGISYMPIGVEFAHCEPTCSQRETLGIGQETLGACVSFRRLKSTV
jgi:hypothetical protein